MSCSKNHNNERLYYNVGLIIVSIDNDCSISDDKFKNPRLCHSVLFKTIDGSDLYTEFTTCDSPMKVGINTEWIYNHKPGDIVHFDYVLKSRFFKINKDYESSID
jgi:hypothetical protein